jgi:hypothetical protein
MNITDYKKKYLKYKAKYLNIKGGTPQMNIDKAKAALRNINFLITAFLPKDIIGEFYMKERNENVNDDDNIVTSHTFAYYMRKYLLYEFTTTENSINDSDPKKIYNPIENYNTLVDGLKSFGVKGLKNYDECMKAECKDRFKSYGRLNLDINSAKKYMNNLMYINAIYILSILKYDYIYNLYNWLIEYGKKEQKYKYTNYSTYILNSIFALKLAIYYLIIKSKNANDTYDTSMFSNLGINEKKLLGLMNKGAIDDTQCYELFSYIDETILSKYTATQIKKIQIKLLEYGKVPTKMGKELTKPVEIDDMLPFIYSLIQQIYEDNQTIYNFGKTDVDDNNSVTTKYNFDSFNGTPSIIIYRSLYENKQNWPYYAEIKDAFTDKEKKYSIDQKKPFSIVKKLGSKYIPIGCKHDGTIAYAYVV